MKHSFSYIILVFLCNLLLIVDSSCQSNSQKRDRIQKGARVFDKKPKFDTLLNEFAKPIGYVNDYGGLYTSDQVYEMDSIIYDFETKTSLQIVIVTFDSVMINSSQVDEVTIAIGNGWKVGGDSSKGIVVGISKPFKKIRIQNGKYVHGILSDSKTKELIDSVFIPEFKNDRYFEGTLSGLNALKKALQHSLAEKTKVQF